MKLKKLFLFLFLIFGLVSITSCRYKQEEPKDEPQIPTEPSDSNGNESEENTNDNTDKEDEGNTSGNTSGNTDNENTGNEGNTSGNTDKENEQNPSKPSDGESVTQGEIKIKSYGGYNEAAYVEFEKSQVNTATYNVYIADTKDGNFKLLDSKSVYIRNLSSVVRADLFGLAKGEYRIKIVPVIAGMESNAKPSTCIVNVKEYDRSGYAHFKYTEGVGAYKDDGTLKDDAIVVYVTEENKDTIMGDIPQLQQYMFQVPGPDWGNKKATSIGWWLNNAQYTKKDSKGNPGNTYSASGKTLGLYSVVENHPIVFRFVGTVTTPEGCTAYDSLNEGGSEGDNGHMARMKDLRNVTLEGVGNDAIIDGWGFHFMASETTGERGKNFEVRNLTFVNNAEDAVGMEGVQLSSNVNSEITAPVKNCWVHHCTFFPGYSAKPAESDKAEGDGSCDFKRGFNFTLSYCYFEYCHKTNLFGSSSTSLQYNISMHHNIWYNCGSRIPLVRNSNVHFYNNLVTADGKASTKTASRIHSTVGMESSPSYVSSLRANAFMYSENNYFDGAKQVFETGEGGGVAKCYGNIYVSCYQKPVGATEVTERTTTVSNTCKYAFKGIDYSSFDTNPNIFYYDSVNGKSDCYLTSAVVAREECLKYSGSLFRTELDGTSLGLKTEANEVTPESAVVLSDTKFVAPFASVKGTSIKDNIYFYNISGFDSNSCKFKGQGVTFKLEEYATVTIELSASVNGYSTGYLVSSKGDLLLSGSGSVVLEPGIYFITSFQKDKETVLTKLEFEKYDSDELKQRKLEEYNTKVSLIPSTITYDKDCYALIKDAMNAYEALGKDLQNEVDNTRVVSALNEYVALGKAQVENYISLIGTVDASSGAAIQLARREYEYLKSIDSMVVISNYDILVTAETAFSSFAVQSCIDKIEAIGVVTLDSKDAIELARAEYDALTEEQKNLITNYNVLLKAEQDYRTLEEIMEVNNQIQEADLNDMASMKAAIQAFNALTNDQQNQITETEKLSQIKVTYTKKLIDSIQTVTLSSGQIIVEAEEMYASLSTVEQGLIDNYDTLLSARQKYNELASTVHEKTFENGLTDDIFTIEGNLSSKSLSKEYNGKTYTKAMKMESSTTIRFNTTTTRTLVIVTDAASGAKIKIDNVSQTVDADGVLRITIQAGEHTIGKDTSLNIFALILE